MYITRYKSQDPCHQSVCDFCLEPLKNMLIFPACFLVSKNPWQVWAWGSNVHGQLGVGVDGANAQRVKPSLIPVSRRKSWRKWSGQPL